MAEILILEPHSEVRDLLLRIVRRLGHEPVVVLDATLDLPSADVVLLEPADENALSIARAVRDAYGSAVVCVSIYPPSDRALALDPVSYLLKPFSLVELEAALVTALERVQPATAA